MRTTRRNTLAGAPLVGLMTLMDASFVQAQPRSTPEISPEATVSNSGTMQRAKKDMRRVLEKLQQLGAKPLGSQSVDETRKGPTPAKAVASILRDDGKDPAALAAQVKLKTQDLTYPTAGGQQKLRLYMPTSQNQPAPPNPGLPIIVYYHGGGWVIADIDTYESSAIALATKSNAIVVSVEYRHAPEHKFPAAHDDAFAAYRWVLQSAGLFGGDPRRIAIAGESAGGNLAINVAIMARDQKIQAPLYMVLVYPVAGTDMNTPSYKKNANAIPLSKAGMEWFVKNVVSKPSDVQDPRLDIIGKANVAGLPSATVITAEIDPLLSDGEMLAQKLTKAGGKTNYHTYEGVTHEFFGMDAVVADAARAQDVASKAFRDAFTQRS